MVWITKYGYKVLTGRVAERSRDLIRQICESRDVAMVPFVGAGGLVTGEAGAVHQWPIIPANARRVSGDTKAMLGPAPLAPRVLSATMGTVDEETIKQDTESQQRDPDDQGFKITVPTD